jgi:uncharacterized protein
MTSGTWPDGTILGGIVGSTAYGLNRPGSDVDRLGVFAASFNELAGLNPPILRHNGTRNVIGSDGVVHEALKFCGLALHCNPTVLELLWLPGELYEVRTAEGARLISVRDAFLSRHAVRSSYMGYASQQFQRLQVRGDGSFSSTLRKRTAKHARHMLRLLHQGLELYANGRLTLRLTDPQRYHDFGEDVASGNLNAAAGELAAAEALLEKTRSPLPKEPNRTEVERWLHETRLSDQWVKQRTRPTRSTGLPTRFS